MFLVPHIHFLFQSLNLIRQLSSRFDQISGCSKLLKYCNVFQKFLPSSKFFLFHTNVSYFSTLHQKSFFLEQNQFLQLLKLVEILHQNVNPDFVCSIIVPKWRRKKLLLYKAPMYPPTKDIKPFGQNDWSGRTWEPYVVVLLIICDIAVTQIRLNKFEQIIYIL